MRTQSPTRRTAVLAAVLGLLAALLVVLAPSPAAAADMDCGDFANQRDAQIFFLNNGGPHSDPHRLDYDSDGIACESNPCPCYYGTSLPSTPAPPPPAPPKPKAVTNFGKVVKVIDGDTVDVRLKRTKKKVRVRLIGIDTPEVYGGVECGGPAASKALKRMLPRGTRVKMRSDPSQDRKDRYGRLLRYVHKAKTGRDMNRAQVWHGRARVYVYAGKPFQRTKSYRAAERKAKKAKRGIWGNC